MKESIIRIHIDERWTIDELTSLVETLQYFNESLLFKNQMRTSSSYYGRENSEELLFWANKYLDKDVLLYDYNRGRIRRMRDIERPPYDDKYKLKLIRFQYASPGIVDIGGVGKIVEQIKDLLLELLKMFHLRKQNKYEHNHRHLQQLAEELSVGKEIYHTLREMGYRESDLGKIWEYDFKKLKSISDLIEKGKIQRIEE